MHKQNELGESDFILCLCNRWDSMRGTKGRVRGDKQDAK